MDRRRAKDIAIVSVAAVLVALSLSGIGTLRTDSSTEAFLPQDDPVVRTNARMEATFGAMDAVVVGISRPDDASLLADPVLALIGEITEELSLLEGVDAVDSIANADFPEGTDDGLAVVPLVQDGTEGLEARLQEGSAFYEGTLISEDRTFASVIVRPKTGKTDLVPAIRDVLDRHWEDGLRFSLVGLPVVKDQIQVSLFRDLVVLAPVVGLLIILVLAFSFRHLAGVVLPLLCLALSASVVLGIMAFLSITVTMATMLVPILLLIVGSAYCIHVMSHFYEEEGKPTDLAIATVVRRNRMPIIMAGATTASGFVAQLASPLAPFRTFGLLSAVGVVISQAAALLLLPALLRLTVKKGLPEKKKRRRRRAHPLLALSSIGGKPLLAVSLLFVLSTFALLPRIQSGTDMLAFFRKDSSLVRDTDLFNEKMDGSGVLTVMLGNPTPSSVLDPRFLILLEAFETTFSKRDEVGTVQTVVPYLKRINVIMNSSESRSGRAPADQGGFDFFAAAPPPALTTETVAPAEPTGDTSFDEIPADPAKYGLRTTGDLQDLLSQYLLLYGGNLSSFLDDDLEPNATLAIVRIRPSDTETLRELTGKIETFWESRLDAGWTVEIGGGEAVSLKLTDLVTESQTYSLLGALAIVYLLVSILFRSPVAGLLSLIPPIFALMGIFCSMALFSIPLDIVTSLLAALAIGVGVDFGIHMLSALKRGDPMGTVMATTGRAILTNAASVTIGFFGLVFSRFVPIRQLGILFCIAMVCAALAGLTVLPAAAIRLKSRFLDPSTGGTHERN